MTSLAEQLEQLGMDVKIKLISAEYVEPEKNIRKILELDKNEDAYKIVRVFYADGEPISVSYIHANVEIGRKFENINMNKDAFLTVLEDFGYQIQYAKENISAVIANDFELETMGIDSHIPILCTERVVYVSGEKPLYVTHDIFNGNRYSLNVVLQRRH